MAQEMTAKEISLAVFERNAKTINKKGLRRTFSSIPTRYSEYIPTPQLGATSKLVLEVVVDKNYVEGLINLLKEKNFTIVGSYNNYFIGNLLADYEQRKDMFTNHKDAMEAIGKDYELQKSTYKDYVEVENDDAKFYFLPINEDIDTLFEFFGVYKEALLAYAKENDITIMMKPMSFAKQVDGFFGFNFLNAEVTDKEEIIDYASSISVLVDFKDRYSVYSGALILTGIGENEEELAEMQVHYFGENMIYNK